jgi:hypothetical protein
VVPAPVFAPAPTAAWPSVEDGTAAPTIGSSGIDAEDILIFQMLSSFEEELFCNLGTEWKYVEGGLQLFSIYTDGGGEDEVSLLVEGVVANGL